MMQFDQLAATEIPPPPENLNEAVHQRLNRILVVLHLCDLFLRALPAVALMFTQPVLAFFKYSVTGRFDLKIRRR
ncbi:MAG: hypothetical protein GTO53_07070 [Planctomycetales bacterium]|nr:hypothetical protein [Planctomycetales bacterium]NIM08897.1 hypothetical protein [Planctomycetales bacterium]NIN08357.1 hypothetical protein [Planctomycetales bacterium]NIN77485.1 hypothetical protein [Planctomycetales bacterium]NIO34657.1 hypothetical protein [Planctomycetales bacterium]